MVMDVRKHMAQTFRIRFETGRLVWIRPYKVTLQMSQEAQRRTVNGIGNRAVLLAVQRKEFRHVPAERIRELSPCAGKLRTAATGMKIPARFQEQCLRQRQQENGTVLRLDAEHLIGVDHQNARRLEWIGVMRRNRRHFPLEDKNQQDALMKIKVR